MTDTTILERRVVIDGILTRSIETPGRGPAILLLHGFTDSADSWRPLLVELARMGRRAVAVDLPGRGHAAPLGRPAYRHLGRFVDALVTTYGEGRPVVLAGNSLGGLVALRAATRDLPLAAVAGLGPAGLAHTRRFQLYVRLARLLHPALRLVELLPVPKRMVSLGARAVHRRLTECAVDASLTDHYASHVRGVKDVARLRSDLLALTAEGETQPLRLDRIRVPVLLVWGERDRLADIAGAPALLAAVPDSRLVVLDTGHCPQVQLPGRVAGLLAELPASAQTRPSQGETS